MKFEAAVDSIGKSVRVTGGPHKGKCGKVQNARTHAMDLLNPRKGIFRHPNPCLGVEVDGKVHDVPIRWAELTQAPDETA